MSSDSSSLSLELQVGIGLAVGFGVYWLVLGSAYFIRALRAHRKNPLADNDSTGSDEVEILSVATRKNVFEGGQADFEELDKNLSIIGDANCLAAELNLYRLKNSTRSSWGQAITFVYQSLKYYAVRTGIYNLMFAYEFLVLISFVFIPSINWGTLAFTQGIREVFSVFIFLFSWTTVLFWTAVAGYSILLIMTLIRRRVNRPLFDDVLEKLYDLMLFVFMIPVLQTCMQQGHCVFGDPAHPEPYLYKDPSVTCFTPIHIFSVVVAGILAVSLYTSAILYTSYLRKHVKDFIRYTETFELALIMGKTLLAAFSVFLGDDPNGGVVSLSVFLIVSVLFWIANFTIQPCRGKGDVANNVRSASYAGCVYTCCCAFAALQINSRELFPSSTPFYVFVGGVVPIMVLAYFINRPRSRKLTLPNQPFKELLIHPEKNIRSSAQLAMQISEKLDLSALYLGDEHTKIVASALNQSKRIIKLDLSMNKIGSDGGKYLADALKLNKSLKVLNLSKNYLGPEGAKWMADSLKVNHTLTILNLQRNGLRDEGTRVICEVLKGNTSITELNLSANFVTDKATVEIQAFLDSNSTLKVLKLSANKITDEGAGRLLVALGKNTTLEVLKLDDNKVSPNTFSSLERKSIVVDVKITAAFKQPDEGEFEGEKAKKLTKEDKRALDEQKKLEKDKKREKKAAAKEKKQHPVSENFERTRASFNVSQKDAQTPESQKRESSNRESMHLDTFRDRAGSVSQLAQSYGDSRGGSEVSLTANEETPRVRLFSFSGKGKDKDKDKDRGKDAGKEADRDQGKDTSDGQSEGRTDSRLSLKVIKEDDTEANSSAGTPTTPVNLQVKKPSNLQISSGSFRSTATGESTPK